ncbi:hypothetical protein ACFCYC_18935 [Streptomyces sp. NPDC056402]|uniref:hypothetical protein n=1 Tax=Streptomyces sp. NPDC056402 TaxID=3345810 RepID=UPI0035DADDC4
MRWVPRYQERADVATMSRYEQRYGLVAEGRLTVPEEAPRVGVISAEEFERIWLEARRTLGATAPPPDADE